MQSITGEGMGDEGTETTVKDDDGAQAVDLAENKVAMNTNAFEIVDDLMMGSVPLFASYRARHGGARPIFSYATGTLRAMTDFAVECSWGMLLDRRRRAAVGGGGAGGGGGTWP
jgi:hypothetical protein